MIPFLVGKKLFIGQSQFLVKTQFILCPQFGYNDKKPPELVKMDNRVR